MKDFGDAVQSIGKKLEKTFEKNADKAVNDPDDGSQADRDARQAGGDTANSAGHAANSEAKNHEPAWATVKNLADRAEAPVKLGWLKFVGAVTAMFVAVMGYFYFTPDPPTVESRKALAAVNREAADQAQIQNLALDRESFNSMVDGIFVQSAPVPTQSTAPVAAAAALPPPIAAVAAEPAKVELVTESGEKTEITTTVGQVYLNSPTPVRRVMEGSNNSPPPSPITHGYDGPGITEDPNSCFVRHCLSGSGTHKGFTVTAVDGNGNTFGTAQISY